MILSAHWCRFHCIPLPIRWLALAHIHLLELFALHCRIILNGTFVVAYAVVVDGNAARPVHDDKIISLFHCWHGAHGVPPKTSPHPVVRMCLKRFPFPIICFGCHAKHLAAFHSTHAQRAANTISDANTSITISDGRRAATHNHHTASMHGPFLDSALGRHNLANHSA